MSAEPNLFDAAAGLSTQRYDLRPLRMDDAPDLLAHFSDPAVTEFMDIEPLETLEDAQGIVRWADSVREYGEGLRWGIRDRVTGAFLGTAGFNTLEVDRGRRAWRAPLARTGRFGRLRLAGGAHPARVRPAAVRDL